MRIFSLKAAYFGRSMTSGARDVKNIIYDKIGVIL